MEAQSWSFSTSPILIRISFNQSSFDPCGDATVTHPHTILFTLALDFFLSSVTDAHHVGEQLVEALRVALHGVEGLQLLLAVLQLHFSLQEPLHVFCCHFLVQLANQLLQSNQSTNQKRLSIRLSISKIFLRLFVVF